MPCATSWRRASNKRPGVAERSLGGPRRICRRHPGSLRRERSLLPAAARRARAETFGIERRSLKLLELQRHAMQMYTSCGWFFDELSGIETVQMIQYAGRVLQLADQLFSDSFEPGFLQHLERAKSNIPEHRDGRTIYEKWVRPAMLDMKDVGAHYALTRSFRILVNAARSMRIRPPGRTTAAFR